MRPFFNRESLWAWPVYAGVGASFGYWMLGVEQRQVAILAQKRQMLLDKRKRRDEREGMERGSVLGQVNGTSSPATGSLQVQAAASME